MNKVCPICGKEFEVTSSQKYCSRECAKLFDHTIYKHTDKTTQMVIYNSTNTPVCKNSGDYTVTRTPEDERIKVARDRYIIRTYKGLYNKVTNSETYNMNNTSTMYKDIDIETARAYIEAHKDMLEDNSIPVKIENTSNNIDINNRLDNIENKLDKIINLLTDNNSHDTIGVSKDMKLSLVSKLLEL